MSHLRNDLGFLPATIAVCCRPEFSDVPPPDENGNFDNAYQEADYASYLAQPEIWQQRLLAAWDAVADALVEHNVHLIRVKPQPGLPDLHFAADSVVLAVNQRAADRFGHFTALASVMNSPLRQQEVSHVIEAAEEFGFYAETSIGEGVKREGTGDLLYLPGHNFFVHGYGPRSEEGSGSIVSIVVSELVVEVPLRIETSDSSEGMLSKKTKAFHLDTIVMPLPDKQVIACFDRMLPQTRALFEELYPPSHRIELTQEESDLFITNGLCVRAIAKDNSENGYTLFLPDPTPERITERLKNWGYGILKFDFEPSKLSGGGLHCMFNFAFVSGDNQKRMTNVHDQNHQLVEKYADAWPMRIREGNGINLHSWQRDNILQRATA